jgi:hypothetical protein
MAFRKRKGWFVLALLVGCTTRTTNLVNSRGGAPDAASSDAAEPTRDATPMFELDDAGKVRCGNVACACSDGVDNDSDGLIDGFDPECTGAGDAYEDSYATGSHGEEQNAKCQDCFFDANSGAGKDGCRRARSCATDGTSAGGTGMCRTCDVEMSCLDSCQPLVPNGCDCFGCCGVWRDGNVVNVLLGSVDCKADALDDPRRCTRCIPAADCANPCGPCELCPGRRQVDLPASCASTNGMGFSCDDGELCQQHTDCNRPLETCQQGCCRTTGI